MTTTPAMGQRRQSRIAAVLPASIGGRLLFLIALALLPMLLLLAWIYLQRYEIRRSQTLQTELEVAQGIATLFAVYVEDVRREAQLAGWTLQTLELTLAQANDMLTMTAEVYPAVISFSRISSDGRVLASNLPEAIGTDISDRDYFLRLTAGEPWTISDLLPQPRIIGVPVFTISHAIRDDNGPLLGAIVAVIDPVRLGEVVLTQQRLAAGAYAIFDRQGVLVYRHATPALSWQDRTQWQEADPVLRETLGTGRAATGTAALHVENEEWMVARVPIPPLGWVAGAGRSVDVAMAPIRRALAVDGALALLVTLLAIGLSALIGRTIVAPLQRLQHDVRAFGEGQLSHRTLVSGPAEVAQTALGFNQMAEEIEGFQNTLEAQVRQRTAELEAANRELESFSYTVAHDLRSPLRAMDGYSKYLQARYAERLDERGAEYLQRIRIAAQRMGRLIDDLLNLARVSRRPLNIGPVDLGMLAAEIVAELRRRDPARRVVVEIAPRLTVIADEGMMRIVMSNLLENAWKFTNTREEGRITVGQLDHEGERVYYVRDNGVGFDMAYIDQLFQPFHRLHTDEEFSGTGIGLALVQRIIGRHGGRVWAEGALEQGATIYFRLGEDAQ